MKAFLLAAGYGTRLRPLTDQTPKCLVRIGGKPLLGIWLDKLVEGGVTDVLINTHHLSDRVNDYVFSRTWPLRISMSYERQLLGSAGTLLRWKGWVANEKYFLACNADGLTDYPVSQLALHQALRRPAATIAAFRSGNPSAGGVITTDENGVMNSFAEKPERPANDMVNAGMYAFTPAVLNELKGDPPLDIGTHLLPLLVGRAHVLRAPGYFRDIGTQEDLRLAQEEWTANDRHANPASHRTGRWRDGFAGLLPAFRRPRGERSD